MTKENPINQTNLAIAAITASFVKALNKTHPDFDQKFLEELSKFYYEIRDSELSHIEAMETLTWTKEFIKG